MARSKTSNEKLKRYQHQIELAQQWRNQEGFDDLWSRLIQLYKGKHFTGLSHEDRIAINISFATINVIEPAISVNRPKITVLANQQENEDRSLFAQAILNYWWQHYDFQNPFRRAAKDFLIIGHGWLKNGWKTVEGQRQMTEAEVDEQYMRAVAERDAHAAQFPDQAHELPSDEDLAASLLESMTVKTIIEDRPFMERISPFDMFVNTEATCMEDASWIAQRIVRPLEDVQKDKRYKQSVRLTLRGVAMSQVSLDSRDRKAMADEIERVVVWEFYDLKTGKMSVFAEGGSDFLIEPMDFPYAVGHPFSLIRNYDVPDQFYPIGDLEMLEPMQLELNATRTALMNNRKGYARKYLYRRSAFGEDGVRALRSDVDNTAVPVDDERPLGDVIAPMPNIPLSADLYNLSEIISGDIREVSGVSEYQRGVSPSVRRTATEAAMIQDATNARSADKLGKIEGLIRDVARKQLQIAQQFLTGEQVARVTGAQGKTMWLPYNRDDVIGEYDFTVEAGSTQPVSDQQRRQDALTLGNVLAPFIEMQIVDPIVLAKHIIQEGFGIRSFDKFIRPDALQQLQMQAAMKEQELLAAQAAAQQAQMPQGAPAQGAPQDPNAQGPVGVGAPQMDPLSLLMAQQQPAA